MIADIERQSGKAGLMTAAITAEEAAKNPNVQAIIGPRIETLTEICQSFLNIIYNNIDLVPYGIRWICKQIKFLTRRRFPDVSADDISTLIGAFFFLRFVNPAIVTPQAYMLVESQPAANPKRTLTLVSRLKSTHSGVSQSRDLELTMMISKCRLLKSFKTQPTRHISKKNPL